MTHHGPPAKSAGGPWHVAEVVRLSSNFAWMLPDLEKACRRVARAGAREDGGRALRRAHRLSDRLPVETLDGIVCDYQAGGVSTVLLGKRYGISDSTVRSLLHSRGVATPQTKLSEADDDEVVRLYEQQLTMKAIAEKFGVDRGTVRNVLKRRGVELRRRT